VQMRERENKGAMLVFKEPNLGGGKGEGKGLGKGGGGICQTFISIGEKKEKPSLPTKWMSLGSQTVFLGQRTIKGM